MRTGTVSRQSLPALAAALWLAGLTCFSAHAQDEPSIERPGPPKLEDFETDADDDGLPDGWYNFRDVKLADGGVVGKTCLRFECAKRSRPARASRAFGVEGKETEAIVIGMWLRAENIGPSERFGEEPMLMIDFLGDQIRQTGRGSLGPWSKLSGRGWVHVAKRIAVPPGTHDAIMSLGLIGSTGVLEVDGMTFDLLPVGGTATTNLVLNGDLELGDPDPVHWHLEGAQRVFKNTKVGAACLQLTKSGSKAMNHLSFPVEGLGSLSVQMMARASGLRGSGSVEVDLYFIDASGQNLEGDRAGARLFRWGGTFPWTEVHADAVVPRGAVQAVLQIGKSDGIGSVWVDDVRIEDGSGQAASWTPYHLQDETTDWTPYVPAEAIEPASALDASGLLEAPAGKSGHVVVKDGRLHFQDGRRARFFGVTVLPPTAFFPKERADELAERLARSGVNLVRLGDLDLPFGPGLALFDDSRDDTTVLDPLSMSKLDHLIAALKQRGIYVALELQSGRRFRAQDKVDDPDSLPPGGGPAAAFDPWIRNAAVAAAETLLTHVNPETGLALRDDPVLAWVTLSGELSIFDLEDGPTLPPAEQKTLQRLIQKSTVGSGARFRSQTEAAQWKSMADDLRKIGLKVPIAGGSHWRHSPPEYCAAQAGPGLDLIDDRLYWQPSPLGSPGQRSVVWDAPGTLVAAASKKRKTDRPYVAGQWCDHTQGLWALPYEAADLLFGVRTAAVEDWDGIVRRGVFYYPRTWGKASPGTSGGEDRFVAPEVVNANPAVFSLLPHAASLVYHARPDRGRRHVNLAVRGRMEIDTPHTQVLAGWPHREPAEFETLTMASNDPYIAIAASALGKDPIARAKRILVTVVGRVQPTGYAWDDPWRFEVSQPGQPPLLLEPARASLVWKRRGTLKAYALDNAGKRAKEASLDATKDGAKLVMDTSTGTTHWELVVE
jgi:hypothetical protein